MANERREETVNEWDEVERVLPGWRALAESVAEELTAWRRAHPRATLTEIETVVFDVGQRLQALALQQVVQASATADVAAQPAAERPTCPTCSGQLEPRGRQRRTIRPARQRTPLELDRSYAVCAECGAGLFPSDGRRGIRRSRSGAGASSKGPTDPMVGALADAGSAGTGVLLPAAAAAPVRPTDRQDRHVLLFSVDGLHASDLSQWISSHPD